MKINTSIAAMLLPFFLCCCDEKEDPCSLFISKKDGPVWEDRSIRIVKVLNEHCALAEVGGFFSSKLVFFTYDDNVLFYDGQTLDVPKEMQIRQIGTYKHRNKNGFDTKTIPAICVERIKNSEDSLNKVNTLVHTEKFYPRA